MYLKWFVFNYPICYIPPSNQVIVLFPALGNVKCYRKTDFARFQIFYNVTVEGKEREFLWVRGGTFCMVHASFIGWFFGMFFFQLTSLYQYFSLFNIRITVLNRYLNFSESLHNLPVHTCSCRGKMWQISFFCNVKKLMIFPQAFLKAPCHCLH